MAKKHPFVVGAALGTIVATATALFFTQTKSGKNVIKDAKRHALHLGKEVTRKVQKVKKLSQKKYEEIVDEVVDEYTTKKKIAKTEAVKVQKELKKKWNEVKKEL